jgi:hypothetical protein
MMTLISIPVATNSPNACPRSAEANSVEHTTTQSLSPETQQALDRWYPEQDDWYGLFPQANKHKLSDFLEDPLKNVSVLLGLGITAVPAYLFLLTLSQLRGYLKASNSPHINAMRKLLIRTSLSTGTLTILGGGLTLLHYLYQKNRNTDTLKGIQILGENATRQEWINYKKSHPEIKQA